MPLMQQRSYNMEIKYINPILEKLRKYRRKKEGSRGGVPLYIEPPVFEDGRNIEENQPKDPKRGITIIDFNIDSDGEKDE